MKVQVTVSDEMVNKIDKYANLMGVSRSALCAMFIGQGIMGYEKTYEILDGLGASVEKELSKSNENKLKKNQSTYTNSVD